MNPLHLVIAYVCLLHLGPLLNLFALLPGARVFPITTAGHLLMVYLTMRYFNNVRRAGLSRLDMVVTGFLVWSLASFVLYFQKDNPSEIGAYAYGVHLYVMPMFGFFAVKMLSIEQQQKALSFLLWSNMFTLVFGLYLWWARPDFYTYFLREVLFTNLEDWSDFLIYRRLQSYLGSTSLGLICAMTVALAGAVGSSAPKAIFVLGVAVPAVVLSFQRGGQVGTFLALIYLIILGRGSRALRPVILAGGIAIGAAAVVGITMQSEGGLEYYLSRKNDYNASVLEGRRGYTVGMDYVTAFPLGVGLGGSGNAASGAGLAQWDKVVDANFMRIFADLGVEGLLMFLLILGMGVYSGLRRRKNAGLSCIIVIYAVVAIGTNVFDGHLTPQLFWLILGMADTTAKASERESIAENTPAWDPDLSAAQPSAANPSPSQAT
jgi:hypothetical protein